MPVPVPVAVAVAAAQDNAVAAPALGAALKHGEQALGTTYEARAEDGGALPAWLKFDPASATFSGTAPAGIRALKVRLVARDSKDQESTVILDLSFPAP